MSRRLGENQVRVLQMLDRYNAGTWYPGAGWVWTNTSTTVRLLDSLVRRGLATKETRQHRRTRDNYPYYTITDEGRAEHARQIGRD